MIVAAVRDTQGQLVTLLTKDFTGPGNFLYWIAALFLVGSVGYIDRLKPLSDGLLILILLALVLSRGNPKQPAGGFFKQLTDALGTTTKSAGTGGVSVGLPTRQF